MTSTPYSHIEESQKLTADAQIDLYQITLKNKPVTFRFKNNNTVTWRGNEYEGMACQVSGDTRIADGEESRASMQIMNPFGIFNMPALAGDLDLAVVTRKRVLLQHIESNANIFEQRMWYVARVSKVIAGQSIDLELRNMTEGPGFQIPVRMYIPPEFPMVTL
jgi:phage-related protein